MPKHTICHGQLSWTGRTKKEASAARDATLEKLLTHEGFVSCVLFCPVAAGEAQGTRGVVLVRRSLSTEPSWWYEFMRPAKEAGFDVSPGSSFVGGSSGSWATRFECVTHLRRHLAQMAYDLGLESEVWLMTGDTEGLLAHHSWMAWQQRYAAARAEGKSDDESWHIASRGV